jgi:uncharacterized glyoxalase superfamily protein PhnB
MKKITANLMVNDVNKTIDYYVNNLDFKFAMGVDANKITKLEQCDDTKLVWAIIKKNDIEIMLQAQHSLINEVPEFKGRTVGGTFTLYISMADTKRFYQKIKNKVEIIKDLHKTFYGAYEFAIKDLNGYILYFAQLQEDE